MCKVTWTGENQAELYCHPFKNSHLCLWVHRRYRGPGQLVLQLTVAPNHCLWESMSHPRLGFLCILKTRKGGLWGMICSNLSSAETSDDQCPVESGTLKPVWVGTGTGEGCSCQTRSVTKISVRAGQGQTPDTGQHRWKHPVWDDVSPWVQPGKTLESNVRLLLAWTQGLGIRLASLWRQPLRREVFWGPRLPWSLNLTGPVGSCQRPPDSLQRAFRALKWDSRKRRLYEHQYMMSLENKLQSGHLTHLI